ncbi:T9SS type A sorting domain-containing protein [Flavobacterium bomense]|uniref:T9SS type A sorting domain-containing protein n=2 Tax=Flavobacterium TaxID=237 RepID=A0A3S0PKJ9_9FLAO|nr:T9SS type A sorting domain-containing protein [Flavobacterium bomense]
MNKLLLTSSFLFFTFLIFAQKSKTQNNEKYLQSNTNIQEFKFNKSRQSPSLLKIKPDYNLNLAGVPAFLVEVLQLDKNSFEFKEIHTNTTKGNFNIVTFSAFYNGVKVEHARYNIVLKKDKVTAITLEHYVMGANVSKTKSLSQDQALEKAKQHVGAENYVWEDISKSLKVTVNQKEIQQLQKSYNEYLPKGELVYVDNYKTKEVDLTLAYKFNIYASKPLSRNNVFVDAANGQILLTDAIIKHADEINKNIEKNKINTTNSAAILASVEGNGATRYAGNRKFQTTLDAVNNRYSLFGTIPVLVNGLPVVIENETRSYNGVGGAPIGVPNIPSYSIYDGDAPSGQLKVEIGDNNWTADEHWRSRFTTLKYPVDNETKNDDIALDAHWGAEIVIKYWGAIHNRSSYDNRGTKVINYVHYGDAYDNAFWNGTAMTYGDGSYQGGTKPNGSFGPLTSMDVCGHEIGHGVCSNTSDLVYARESGAMNEGFSDIWAASVENYVLTTIDSSLPYDPWGIGEQIDERDGGLAPGAAGSTALRWMDDPKANTDPDSYGGKFWSDPQCVQPSLANDQCGVHSNSGVLNKWYYLLVEGSGKSFTRGKAKAAADDQINDALKVYSVKGLGFLIAEQITFKAEVLLTPNATFQEMRDASILVAGQEYGTFSNEVKQVTNAWYAVNVGNEFIAPDPNQLFFESANVSVVNEQTATQGCAVFNTIEVKVTGVNITSPQTINLDFSGSTATINKDFTTSATSLSFDKDGTKTILLNIFNDGIVEGVENIIIKFNVNTPVAQSRIQNITIVDNDYVPAIGIGTVEIFKETFTTSNIPSGWETKSVIGLDPNVWLFNGPNTLGKAYVSNRTASQGATYDSTQNGNLLLISKLIDTKGMSDVTVAFDWQAGGETDQVDNTALFDYGEFVYSLDGANYNSLAFFAGTASGAVMSSGKYNKATPALNNTQFHLAWRWYNDALLGTAFSFTLDNVVVSGTPASVESDLMQFDSETVKIGNQVYFLSDQDGDVIGLIENATKDLGCVTLTISESGSKSNFTNIAGSHSGKVIKVEADGLNAPTASYDLTLFFTDAETSEFSDPSGLRVIKVNSNSINDAKNYPKNFQINGGLGAAYSAEQYRTYKGNHTGSGTFALVTQATLSTQKINGEEFKIYPTVLSADKVITISSARTPIDRVDIYTLNGGLISALQLESSNEAKIPVSKLSSGMYFLVINGNKSDTFKFLMQ